MNSSLLITSRLRFCLRSALQMLLCFALLPGNAVESCIDVYEAKLSVRPAGEKYWISPDRDFKLDLPATHSAKSGSLEILVSVKRRDKDYVTAEFTLITLEKREAFLASIQMDKDNPKAFAASVISSTGSEFALALIPVCSNT